MPSKTLRPAVAVTIAAGALLLGAVPAIGASRPLHTGLVDQEAYETASPLAFAHTKAAGSRFVRLTLPWRLVAPSSKPPIWDPTNPADPNYDWSSIDAQVRGAVQAGLRPVLQIETAPSWAQRCHSEEFPDAPCDPDPEAVAGFARAAASRYDGSFLGLPRVRYWMLFNEPNLNNDFNPQYRDGKPVSPLLYRRLINAFAPAVNAVQQSNVIVGPGMAPLSSAETLAPLDFMRRLLCMRGHRRPRPARGCNERTVFDVWAMNPYTTGGPTHHAAGRDNVSLGDLPEMRRLLRAAERAGRIRSDLHPVRFWVTEFSWDSRPPDPGGLSWRIHARWLAEAMFRAWSAGVSTFFWFGLRDFPQTGKATYSHGESGLYLRGETLAQDKPKRALRAFSFPFVAFRDREGIRVWGRSPTSGSGKVLVQVRVDGSWRTVARLQANRFGIFRELIRTRFGRAKRGLVRARYRGKPSLPFSLRYVGDFYAPPFGLEPGQSHVPQRRRVERWLSGSRWP